MKIAILGTRGIPNNYGGFEQFAEYISVKLVQRGHEVYVYNPHFYKIENDTFNGVSIRYAYDPEKYIGASANFIYDYLCLKDALSLDLDIILECGYHSNAPSYYLLKNNKKRPFVVTNMDGIEWKRSKWGLLTRLLIKRLEKIAVEKSDFLVSDNVGIQKYYQQAFNAESKCIAYGANPVIEFNLSHLSKYNLQKDSYFLLIARLEIENNIEMILDGYVSSGNPLKFLVIGNTSTKYGLYLKKKYASYDKIIFLGSVYDKNVLDSLRCYSRLYFHGHSVGGTNPSLLEAMASRALIAAYGCSFNKEVLHDNAFYFLSSDDVKSIIDKVYSSSKDYQSYMENNVSIIQNDYSWDHITDLYENYFLDILAKKRE